MTCSITQLSIFTGRHLLILVIPQFRDFSHQEVGCDNTRCCNSIPCLPCTSPATLLSVDSWPDIAGCLNSKPWKPPEVKNFVFLSHLIFFFQAFKIPFFLRTYLQKCPTLYTLTVASGWDHILQRHKTMFNFCSSVPRLRWLPVT